MRRSVQCLWGILLMGMLVLQACAPKDEWVMYREKFIHPDGRILDTANRQMSHSEGQGYAMLLAVHYDDEATFERLRAWTFQNLGVRKDSLFAWKWESIAERQSGVRDLNNATDGDLLIAWALLRAWKKWKREDYLQSARKIAADIRSLCVRPSVYGLILLPGLQGFEKEQGIVVNLSYWVFPALSELQEIDPAPEWAQLIQSGQQLIQAARFGQWQLPPDWLLLSEPLQCAPDFEPMFGYNAVRIPLYILWHNPKERERMTACSAFWSQTHACFIHLKNNRRGFTRSSQGIQAIAFWARAAQQERIVRPKDLPFLHQGEDYFSASLLLLTKMALQEVGSP